MRIITLALATVFLLSGSAPAQSTHTVKQGQTLSHIAAKYGVSQSAILKANRLSSAHKLKLGQRISIPRVSKSSKAKLAAAPAKSAKSSRGGYVVRNGDHDWAIAKKLGTSVSELHRLNPGANWRNLQIGQALRVPGKGVSLASLAPPVRKVSAGGSYLVKKNDNDWIIARRVGATPSQLRALNPGVKWTNLQIGQKLRVPGGGSSSGGAMLASTKISTRHAKIAKDDVTIRRGPSTKSAKVTTVPAGTYVTVLDRESGWYKLKFPKGTVGWVRGDMLKPLSSRLVARTSTRTRRTSYVASNYTAPPRPLGTASGGLLDTAYDLIGTRYRYGGTSRSGGLDCSAFTGLVFKTHGVKLPRTSREQSKVGRPVAKNDLKSGDLVFFSRGRRGVGHVGIYIGNGKFIHSSSGRGVTTDNLNAGTYARRYMGGRTVAKMTSKEKADLKKLEAEAQEMLKKSKEQERIATKGESEPAFDPPAKDGTPPPAKGADEIIR